MSLEEYNIAEQVQRILEEVKKEMGRSLDLYGLFRSPHDAVIAIRESYIELEHKVFHGALENAGPEAIQLVAKALLFCIEYDLSMETKA